MAAASTERTAIGDLPPGWKIKTVSEVATKVGSGATPFGGKSVYLTQRVSHALIRSQHVFDRHFDSAELAYISEQHSRELRNAEVRSGDVLLNITGDGVTFARACLAPDGILPACVNQHVSIIRVNREVCEPGYLLSFLTHPLAKRYMESFNTGGSRRALTKGHIESFEIPLPPLPVQRRIAGILSAYDELMENSQRRIRLLEAMARALYREWFVHFRFPGHETHPRVASPLGDIPQGWLLPLTDHVDFKEGPGLRNWQYRDEGIPFLNIRTLVDNDIDFSKVQFLDPQEVESKYQHFLLSEYDHVVSSSGTIGRIVTIRAEHLPLMLNTSIIRMRPKGSRMGRWLLKHYMLSDYFQNQAKSFAVGAAQANFGPIHLKQMHIIAPDEEIASEYERMVAPMELQTLALARQIQTLRRTRDLLLPRLLSGQVELKTEAA